MAKYATIKDSARHGSSTNTNFCIQLNKAEDEGYEVINSGCDGAYFWAILRKEDDE